MNEFENLKFASLLHDIGKFYQRTGKSHSDEFNNVDFGYSGAHSKWSADFISKYWNNDIANLALYHHNFKQAENILLEEIIVSSDSHSAFERIKSEDKQDVLQTPLLSIFSKINIGDNCDLNEYYVPLQPLTLDNGLNYLKPTERKVMEGWNLTPEYQRLWTKFEKEMGKIKNPYDFKTILSLLRKYTSTMPSAAYVSEADISLYDHLKTTSAISIARYNYLNEVKDLKKTSNQEVYLAINGDISGIQDFIYKVSSPQDAQKGMSKRLRGRSLYLTLLCDAIVQYIIKMLNLDECNILFVGGGRFTILAHNTQNVKNKLDNLKNKLNKKFIEDFDAELYLVLTYVSFAGKDFKHFNEVTRELSKLSEEEKKHKFNNELENIFKFESPKYQKACNVCGNLINTNQSTCDTCLKHENLGLDIANAKYMIKCISETNHKDFSLYFEELNIGYIFKKSSKNLKEKIETYTENFEHINVSRLNDTDFLNLNNELNSFDNVSYTFSFIGNNVPIVNNKDVLRFDELADISKGANKLGILKMDVDNLGKVFSLGFGKGKDSSLSISRVSTLSSMLDLFFSGFINKICENYNIYTNGENLIEFEDSDKKLYKNGDDENKVSTIYINYSGGDDLLVIGPYDDIIKFSIEIRDKFKQWTCNNPSLNISAGISIVNHKFPIGKSAIMADEYLEISKECGKDKITVFGETLSWDNNEYPNFNELMEFSKYLEENIETNKISNGFLYSMLNIWNNYYKSDIIVNSQENFDIENENKTNFKEHMPVFKYKLRTISDNKIKEKLNSEGLKYLPWIKVPVSYISLRLR